MTQKYKQDCIDRVQSMIEDVSKEDCITKEEAALNLFHLGYDSFEELFETKGEVIAFVKQEYPNG